MRFRMMKATAWTRLLLYFSKTYRSRNSRSCHVWNLCYYTWQSSYPLFTVLDIRQCRLIAYSRDSLDVNVHSMDWVYKWLPYCILKNQNEEKHEIHESHYKDLMGKNNYGGRGRRNMNPGSRQSIHLLNLYEFIGKEHLIQAKSNIIKYRTSSQHHLIIVPL